MADHITRDPIYDTVDRDDFDAMIEVRRYAERTGAFDEIIASTDDHFWDPNDPAYVDFQKGFDTDREMIMPREFVIELNCAVTDRLDEGQQIRLANEATRFNLSQILHGEQGALSLSASLCQILRDPGAQEYAANQVREEARHVHGFARYMESRFGTPLPAGSTLAGLMNELVVAPEVYKKLVGMQIVVEGLALYSFREMRALCEEPLLKDLLTYVARDDYRADMREIKEMLGKIFDRLDGKADK